MDADILRFILFLAGIALILGIYLWDRRKRAGLRVHASRRKLSESRMTDTEAASTPDREAEGSLPRHEPIWRRTVDEVAAPPSSSGMEEAGQVDEVEAALKQLEDIVQQENVEPALDKIEQAAFAFDVGEPAIADMDNRNLPQKILQLNVRVRSATGKIPGATILQGAEACGLVPGDMQIFHRYPEVGGRHPLFSMASLVEPGVFPLDQMDAFSTPGITLFAQLPGPLDAMQTFEEMLAAAEQLARLFGAEIQDETHSDLSHQTVEHMREEIQEYGRQLRLAKIRK